MFGVFSQWVWQCENEDVCTCKSVSYCDDSGCYVVSMTKKSNTCQKEIHFLNFFFFFFCGLFRHNHSFTLTHQTHAEAAHLVDISCEFVEPTVGVALEVYLTLPQIWKHQKLCKAIFLFKRVKKHSFHSQSLRLIDWILNVNMAGLVLSMTVPIKFI